MREKSSHVRQPSKMPRVMSVGGYMKIIYVHCGEETNIRDPRSYEHQLTSNEITPEKKIKACTGFEPMTSVIPVKRSTNCAKSLRRLDDHFCRI